MLVELDKSLMFEKVLVKWDWRRMSSPGICYLIRDLEDQQEYTKCPGRLAWLDWCIEIGYKELEDRVNRPKVYTDSKGVILAMKEAAGFKGLVEVIDDYTDVFVHYGQYTFRCPIHDDKEPSGKIYQNASWHCFGCGADGDILDAYIKMGRLDFKQALYKLSSLTGILLKGNKSINNNISSSYISKGGVGGRDFVY